VHQRDFPLLLMTDGMRHDPKPEVAPIAELSICHCDRSLVMPGHELEEYEDASVDPSLSTSTASSMPGIDARSCAEQTCLGSANQFAHQCERILASPFGSPP
jgi:hypothetical protein